MLLLPLANPFVYFVNNVAKPPIEMRPEHACATCLTVWPVDCADAMINAFDRRAVPIFLPYLFELDALSWWASQEILYHITGGCVGGEGGAVMGFQPVIWQHADYPRSRPIAEEMELVRAAFPELFAWPLLIPGKLHKKFPDAAFEQGDCMDRNLPYRHANGAVAADVARSSAWTRSPEFRTCARVLEPRFCAFALNVSQPHNVAGVLATEHVAPLPATPPPAT